jgi:hypothetical protein
VRFSARGVQKKTFGKNPCQTLFTKTLRGGRGGGEGGGGFFPAFFPLRFLSRFFAVSLHEELKNTIKIGFQK